ncbi:MAG: iron chelate uptake ABC transporter family permease subunit [Candidatus Cloacimonadota bacterium]|nr:iron chelate uptake ABC transporter family permease subunit [Candidatus Cloacimonadota bacterium]
MRNRIIIIVSVLILSAIVLFALLNGSASVNIFSLSETGRDILFRIRIPRIVLGLITGLVLATSGGVLQGMLNNPLAEPYLLGISSGAALGSIIAIVLNKIFLMPIFGFGGALLTIILVWKIGKKGKIIHRTQLILSGIIISLFFSAIIALLMSIFQRELGQIFSILMGNLGYIFSKSSISILWIMVGISIIGVTLLNIFSNRINILSLGDYTADSLGVNVYKTRKFLFIITSLLVGMVVAFTGIIGFVGLIIPHICRILVGPDNRYLLPLSGILGAGFLVFCDTIARSILVIELPVGVITALFGAPFFVYLLKQKP